MFRYLNDLRHIDSNVFNGMVNHIYLSELQLNKASFPLPRPHFRFTFIYMYIGWFFLRLKFMISEMILILLIFDFKMMFLILHPMVFIFLNVFVLLECPVMLLTSIFLIKFRQQKFSNKGINIINIKAF